MSAGYQDEPDLIGAAGFIFQGPVRAKRSRPAEPADSAVKRGQRVVAIDPRYFRPSEVDTLLGDPSKARDKLGWSPRVTFPELVAEMMREDLKTAQRDALIRSAGFRAFDHHE